jgi:hypothetical protein
MRIMTLGFLFLGFTLVGCENKGASNSGTRSTTVAAPTAAQVASCNSIDSESLCREWGAANIEAAGLDSLKGLCAGGAFKVEPCPKDKRVGSCVTPEGTKISYAIGGYPSKPDTAAKRWDLTHTVTTEDRRKSCKERHWGSESRGSCLA